MPFQVYCGPFQPSLETAFLKRLEDLSPGPGKTVWVVTPSRVLSDRLQRLVALEAGKTYLNLRFHTFYTLALEILNVSGGPSGSIITDETFHDKLMDRLLEEHFARHTIQPLSTNQGPAPSGGVKLSRRLAAAFRESIRDLEEAGVEPDQFLEYHFDDLFRDEDEKARVQDLLVLQKKFSDRLARLNVLPYHGLAREAAARLRENPAMLSNCAEILYYGFYDLSGVQADFFQAVSSSAPVTVFFPYRKDHPAFGFSKRFYELKLHQGGRAPENLPNPIGGRALGLALDALFDPARVGELPRPDALKMIHVSGLRDEAWRVAKEILALREATPPVDFNDIGIVARTMEPYRAVLSDVLEENAIPFSMEGGEPLRCFPLARIAFSLLSWRRRDCPARAFLDILGSPYFAVKRASAGSSHAPGSLLHHWKRIIERVGVHSGWMQWRGKLEPWTREDFQLFPHRAAEGEKGYLIPRQDTESLWAVLEDLHGRLDSQNNFKDWRGMAEHAKTLLKDFLIVSRDEKEQRVWERLVRCVDDIMLFDHLGEPVRWDVFLDALEDKLQRATLEREQTFRGVRVMDAMAARGESFKYLFLIGLQEGVFPRQVREDPLLRDSARNLFQQPAGYWILPKLAGYDEEKLLFYLTVASASERLYCLYPRSDDAGKAKVPSIYLLELARACGRDLQKNELESVPRSPSAKWKTVPFSHLSPKEISLSLALHDQDASPFWSALGKDADSLRGGLDNLLELNRFGEPGSFDGLTGAPKDFLRGMARRGVSPTAMDEFARCPFRFFLSRVMELGDLEEPTERGDLAAWVRGSIYHRILHLFYAGLQAAGHWSKAVETPWLSELDRAVEKAFAEFSWQELGLYPLLWESAKRQMLVQLRRFLERDLSEIRAGGWTPAFFERSLRAEGVIEGYALQGRVDRLDIDEAGRRLRVVDYKTRFPRSQSSMENRIFKGQLHQPLFYLELAVKDARLGLSDFTADSASYSSVESSPESPDGKSVQKFSGDQWRRTRDGLLRRVRGLLDDIEQGYFLIRPEDGRGGVCEHCPFDSVCRKAHGPTRWRAENSEWRAKEDESRRQLAALKSAGKEIVS